MCMAETCKANRKDPKSATSSNRPVRRRRLWEIEGGYQCSILGTCLSLERTKKILKKAGAARISSLSDYEVHCHAVSAAQSSGPVAKLLDKALERAHESAGRRYFRMHSVEMLRQAWRQDASQGNISGAYWALMTHPATSRELIAEAFGFIHMLGHQIGNGNRERLKRHDLLEAKVEGLERRLIEERGRFQSEREGFLARIDELEAALKVAMAENPDKGEDGDGDPAPPDVTPASLQRAERLRDHAIRTVEALRTEEAELKARVEAHRRCLGPLSAPGAVPPPPTGDKAGEASRPCPGSPCAECDLGGCVVLYVGGDRGMVPHLRRLARAANIELLHHDGGREDGWAALPRLCTRADAVLCPMDRVSHIAVHKVKRACSGAQKRFIPLRRASLEAFEGGLRQLAEDGPSSVSTAGA